MPGYENCWFWMASRLACRDVRRLFPDFDCLLSVGASDRLPKAEPAALIVLDSLMACKVVDDASLPLPRGPRSVCGLELLAATALDMRRVSGGVGLDSSDRLVAPSERAEDACLLLRRDFDGAAERARSPATPACSANARLSSRRFCMVSLYCAVLLAATPGTESDGVDGGGTGSSCSP